MNNLRSQYFQELMGSKTMKYNCDTSMLPITFLCPSINPLMKAKLARIYNQVATHEKVFTYNSQLMRLIYCVPFPYEKWIIPTCSSSCTFISPKLSKVTYIPLFLHSLGESTNNNFPRVAPTTHFLQVHCLSFVEEVKSTFLDFHPKP